MSPRQAVLLGNPGTKRTVYLEQAAKQCGLSVLPALQPEAFPAAGLLVVDWKEWSRLLTGARSLLRPDTATYIKIDPPLWESCRLEELDALTASYRKDLEILAGLEQQAERILQTSFGTVTFFNHPRGILEVLDKRACKMRLTQAGLAVTEMMIPEDQVPIRTAGQLIQAMIRQHIHQVFVKPVCGSGAAGVSAFRIQPGTGRMVLYTCAAESPDGGLVNTKRLVRCEDREQIRRVLDKLLALDCIVERWYPKAQYKGFSYDLRVVMQNGELDYILARLSKGPVTNLHLNNHPVEYEALCLPVQVLSKIRSLCRSAMSCFPSLSCAGIDILLEKGSLRPRIIEMNAQGDLIYQDIYQENRIYLHQAEMMKQWLKEGRIL